MRIRESRSKYGGKKGNLDDSNGFNSTQESLLDHSLSKSAYSVDTSIGNSSTLHQRNPHAYSRNQNNNNLPEAALNSSSNVGMKHSLNSDIIMVEDIDLNVNRTNHKNTPNKRSTEEEEEQQQQQAKQKEVEIGQEQENTEQDERFYCPYVVYVAGLGLYVNWFLIAQCSLQGLGFLLIYLFVSLLSYFGYGYSNSVGRKNGWKDVLKIAREKKVLQKYQENEEGSTEALLLPPQH